MQEYDWMIKYTPQTVWINRKGILIWLSLYAGILGGGAYLISLLFNSIWGMFISWLIIAVIKSGLHVFHSERPMRLWRMIFRPQTSWISRGLILTILLIIFGACQLAFSYWMPGTTGEIIFKVLAGIMAFGVMSYTGFTLNYVNGISLWNSAILPIIFIMWGFLSGLALVIVTGAGVNAFDTRLVLGSSLVALIATSVLITLYIWTATYIDPAAKQSVKSAASGSLGLTFWIGAILIGIVIPLVTTLTNYLGNTTPSTSLATLSIIFEIIGGLSFTYTVLKAGYYSPLL
jgi:sulfite dehydrogenase (quinone) subunit SoeC